MAGESEGPSKRLGFAGGSQLLYHNDADALLFRARMGAGVFTVVLAALVFLIPLRMFGAGPALTALA